MESPNSVLLRVLLEPECGPDLTMREWRGLVAIARGTGLLARLGAVFDERGLITKLPHVIQTVLHDAVTIVEQQHAFSLAELDRLSWVLRKIDTPIVALKGAAYLVGEHQASIGRRCNDVDILVAPHTLNFVEDALMNGGWDYGEINERDAAYYRKWLQELPPMHHKLRGSVLDVHHALLPRIDRVNVPTQLLLDEIVAVRDTGLFTLSARDMLLHSAAHLFRMRDVTDVLRDIGDIDLLLREFSQQPRFWIELLERARQFGLERSLFYALEFAQLWYATPVPDDVCREVLSWRPNRLVLALQNHLFRAACAPSTLTRSDNYQRLSLTVLMLGSVPRLSVVFDPLYWTKRLPVLNQQR